jgi:hypothetical protein
MYCGVSPIVRDTLNTWSQSGKFSNKIAFAANGQRRSQAPAKKFGRKFNAIADLRRF